MSALRWLAVLVAVIGIVDPRVPWPRLERPAVRLRTGADAAAQQLRERLFAEGFVPAADGEAATIATVDAAPPAPLPPHPLFVMTDEGGAPDVSVVEASASAVRVAQQAIGVTFAVRARGASSATTTIRLEDGGLTVATLT